MPPREWIRIAEAVQWSGISKPRLYVLLNKGLIDVKPLISATLPFRDSGRAFALAADRSQAMKVLLDFE